MNHINTEFAEKTLLVSKIMTSRVNTVKSKSIPVIKGKKDLIGMLYNMFFLFFIYALIFESYKYRNC